MLVEVVIRNQDSMDSSLLGASFCLLVSTCAQPNLLLITLESASKNAINDGS